MMCDACERGDHLDCGMQTWCECDCAGPDGLDFAGIQRSMVEKIEADLFATICGPIRKPRPTAIRLNRRCPKCGPVLLCADHMAMVT